MDHIFHPYTSCLDLSWAYLKEFCLQVIAEEDMKNIKHAKSTNSNKEIIKRNYQKHQEVIQLENWVSWMLYISYCFPIDSKSGRTTKHFDISTYANFEFCILPQQSYIACLCVGLLGKRNRVNSFCYYRNFFGIEIAFFYQMLYVRKIIKCCLKL